MIPKNPISFGIFISKFHKKWAISALSFVFVATAVDKFSVVVFENLSNAIAASPITMSTVWFWAILFPGAFFIAQKLWRSSGFTGMRWLTGFRATAYQLLFEYLTLHSKDYFNSRFSGSLASKISNAVDGIENLTEKVLWRFLPLFLGILWYIFYSWTSDARLGVIIVVWSTLFLCANVWFGMKLQPYSYAVAAAASTLKGKIVDALSNISLVHEYAYIAGERNYIKTYVDKQRRAEATQWWLSEWVLLINGILISGFMMLMIGTSVYLYQQHTINIGVVVMIVVIVADLSRQLFFLGQEIRDAGKFFGQAREGLEEILRKHTIVDIPDAPSLMFSRGVIAIDLIDFEYENTKVFANFSLTIPAGQKIGLVGKSGAGKTTLASLLLRHFDVQNGVITIDGQNITQVRLDSLRRAIAFVPQDTSLFHRSIKDNIRYSNPDATEEEVEHAAALGQADEFIQNLPDKYDTLVGERGVKLSGGQRQRIAIARAFLKNAPILILDEATSSLDSESEHAIQKSLEELMKQRTVIAIAHRLSTLKKMDRIVVIADGKIVEDGNPEELLKKPNGVFKHMWEHQVKGFIIDE